MRLPFMPFVIYCWAHVWAGRQRSFRRRRQRRRGESDCCRRQGCQAGKGRITAVVLAGSPECSCLQKGAAAKSGKEWLSLKGVAEYAKEFSDTEFALAALAQRLFPSKWTKQASLFDRVAAAAATGGGGFAGGTAAHAGRKTAAQLETLQKHIAASASARVALKQASLALPGPGKGKASTQCPSCKQPLLGHDTGKCASIQKTARHVRCTWNPRGSPAICRSQLMMYFRAPCRTQTQRLTWRTASRTKSR